MPQNLESSLLYKREDGSQGFVHDTYKEFLFAKGLNNNNVPERHVVRMIHNPQIYSFYSSTLKNSDNLLKSHMNKLNGMCLKEYISSMGYGEYLKGLFCLLNSIEHASMVSYDCLKDIFASFYSHKKKVSSWDEKYLLETLDFEVFSNIDNVSRKIEKALVQKMVGLYPSKYDSHLMRRGQKGFYRGLFLSELRIKAINDGVIDEDISKLLFRLHKHYTLRYPQLLGPLEMADFEEKIISILGYSLHEGSMELLSSNSNSECWWRALDSISRKWDPDSVAHMIELMRTKRDKKLRGKVLLANEGGDYTLIGDSFPGISPQDCQLCFATSPAEAFSYLNMNKFDLVILFNLPSVMLEYFEQSTSEEWINFFNIFKKTYNHIPLLVGYEPDFSFDSQERCCQVSHFQSQESLGILEPNSFWEIIEHPINYPDSASYIQEALVMIGPKAIPHLQPFLKDKDLYIRQKTAQFIEAIQKNANTNA